MQDEQEVRHRLARDCPRVVGGGDELRLSDETIEYRLVDQVLRSLPLRREAPSRIHRRIVSGFRPVLFAASGTVNTSSGLLQPARPLGECGYSNPVEALLRDVW